MVTTDRKSGAGPAPLFICMKNGMDLAIHAALFLVPKPGLECKKMTFS